MGLLLVEVEMQSSCLCFVVFSLSLALFWFVVLQLLADQIKHDKTLKNVPNLFLLSTSFALPLLPLFCRLLQGLWSWDKEPLQWQVWRQEQGNWTECKFVNLPVRRRMRAAVAALETTRHWQMLVRLETLCLWMLVAGHYRVWAESFFEWESWGTAWMNHNSNSALFPRLCSTGAAYWHHCLNRQ